MARHPNSQSLTPPPIPGADDSPARKARRARVARKVFVVVVCMCLVGLVVLPTTLLLLVGMVPTIAALMSSRDEGIYRGVTVGVMNFAGCLVPLLVLWTNNHSIGQTTALLTDPFNYVIMYGAAALGWGVFYAVPPTVLGIMRWYYEMDIKRQEKIQKDLVKEWGDDVAIRAAAVDQAELISEATAPR